MPQTAARCCMMNLMERPRSKPEPEARHSTTMAGRATASPRQVLGLLCIMATIGSAVICLISGVDHILRNLCLYLALLVTLSLLAFKSRGTSDSESLRCLGILGLFFCLGLVLLIVVNGLVHSGISADRRLEEGLRALVLLGGPLSLASIAVVLTVKTDAHSS